MFKVKIHVTLRKSVFDPQGETVLSALHTMHFTNAKALRVGRFFEMDLDVKTEDKAREEVKKMCESLLVNPVIEDYHFDVQRM